MRFGHGNGAAAAAAARGPGARADPGHHSTRHRHKTEAPAGEAAMLNGPLFRSACAICFVAAAIPARAQGTRADYESAEELRGRTQGKVAKTRVEPHWFANNTRFWYRNDLSGGNLEFIVVD